MGMYNPALPDASPSAARRSHPMILRLFLVLLFLGAILGGIFGWKHLQQQQQAAMQGPPPPPVVASARVEPETWGPRLTAVGSLVAVQGIDVANEVPGLVREIQFESGQMVKAGDVLVQIDDAVDQADLLGLLALRDLAEIKVKRLQTLLKDRSTSQSDYDEAKATLDGAEAAVAAKRATIAKKRILAPFAGRLGIRKVDLGDYLPAGSPIVALNTLDPVYADYSLPERDLTKVRVGQQVVVTVAAYPGRDFPGHISAVDSGVDVKTRNIRIRATPAQPRSGAAPWDVRRGRHPASAPGRGPDPAAQRHHLCALWQQRLSDRREGRCAPGPAPACDHRGGPGRACGDRHRPGRGGSGGGRRAGEAAQRAGHQDRRFGGALSQGAHGALTP